MEVCSCNLGYTLDIDNFTCSGEKLLSSACPCISDSSIVDCICIVRIHLAAWLNLYENSLLSKVYRHNNYLFVCTNFAAALSHRCGRVCRVTM